jgi:hypothetical protein
MDIAKIRQQLISDPEVHDTIAQRAFEIYVHRHGGPGSAAEDWLRAESEILPRLVHEIVERNRAAIEAHDEADPTVRDAAAQMRHEIDAHAGESASTAPARKAGAKPTAKAAKDQAKPAARKVAVKPAAKKAPSEPAAKKPAAKKAASEPAAGDAPAKKPARKAAPKKKE